MSRPAEEEESEISGIFIITRETLELYRRIKMPKPAVNCILRISYAGWFDDFNAEVIICHLFRGLFMPTANILNK